MKEGKASLLSTICYVFALSDSHDLFRGKWCGNNENMWSVTLKGSIDVAAKLLVLES